MKKCYALSLSLSLFSSFAISACAQSSYDDALKKRLNELNPKPETSYFIVKDIIEGNAEQAAVNGFSWSTGTNNRMVVGGAFRAYTESIYPVGIWGANIEAYGNPRADVQLAGVEVGVYQRNHANRQVSVGINTVFGNRLGGEIPVLGENSYNEHSVAWYVSGYPRSQSGEYSGWNRVMKIEAQSLDRTKKVPYAVVIDLLKQRSEVPVYLLVYQCGNIRCGIKPTERGLELWKDVDGNTWLSKIL